MTRLASLRARLPRFMRRSSRLDRDPVAEPPVRIPDDPRRVLAGTLDPDLEAIRSMLRPHGRRLWLRRMVRRAWSVLAAVIAAELALAVAARLVPIEAARAIAAALPLVGAAVLALLAWRVRPSLGEAAIAVDREAGLGDRSATALALAIAVPDAAGVPTDVEDATTDRKSVV